MTSQFSDMTSISLFWRCFVSLVKFRYWAKFHVNIITGFGIVTIFFLKRLNRSLEIGNTPVWVSSNIWRLEQFINTKFGTNVSNRMLLNATKLDGDRFYRFWVIKGKPTGRGVKLPPPPPRLGLKTLSLKCKIFAISLVETACIFLICLIATVQIWMECETQES